MPRPIVRSQPGSTLPQESAGVASCNIRVLDAFYQFLPNKATTFFQRVYFADYPRPVQVGGLPGFPRGVQLARIQVPQGQSIIIKNVGYRVYEHSGIDVEDIVEVEPSRTIGVFGFQTAVGNRGFTDFNTNITTKGDIINFGSGNPGTTASFPPTPGQGSFFPFAGSSQQGLENFAAYARSGQPVECTVQILRSPPYDTRRFSVEISGLILPSVILDKIQDHLFGSG